jgi:hypothetical protein
MNPTVQPLVMRVVVLAYIVLVMIVVEINNQLEREKFKWVTGRTKEINL